MILVERIDLEAGVPAGLGFVWGQRSFTRPILRQPK